MTQTMQQSSMVERVRVWIQGPASSAAEQVRRLRVRNTSRNTEVGSQVEAADSGPVRRKGLLGRTRLEDGGGLWIIPCEAVHTFGMQFPIDLVYLDRQKRVVKVKHAVGPSRLSACLTAHSVLELPAGAAARAQITRGDRLEMNPAL